MNERKKLVLHIGQHKTGSKFLQTFLALNGRNLNSHGILYPTTLNYQEVSAYRNSHFNLYALLRKEIIESCNVNASDDLFWTEHGQYAAQLKSISELFGFIEMESLRINAHTIVMSSEDIFDMHTAHELDFSLDLVKRAAIMLLEYSKEFKWDPIIVIYLRRPDYLLNAHYAQFIKGKSSNTIEFNEFHTKFSPRLDALKILDIWGSVFDKSQLKVRPYDDTPHRTEIVSDFFYDVLNLNLDDAWISVPQELEYLNITPDPEYTDLIRQINHGSKILAGLVSREDLLRLAFEKRSNHALSSFLSETLVSSLIDKYDNDYKLIAEKFMHRKKFFIKPWIAQTQINEHKTCLSTLDKFFITLKSIRLKL